MSVVGSPREWVDLLERMLPELLRLTVEVWNAIPRPLVNDKEDAITELLCRALRRSRTARNLPFYIQLQMVELDPAADQELGRLDIAFLPTGVTGGPSESVYFCLECKRLNVVKNGRKRPGGSDYVMHGMIRFVNGQYANAVQHGGMLGYVLDNDIPSAISNVELNVRNHHASLKMDPPGGLFPSSILTSCLIAKESFHHRPTGQFRIHHMFVGT